MAPNWSATLLPTSFRIGNVRPFCRAKASISVIASCRLASIPISATPFFANSTVSSCMRAAYSFANGHSVPKKMTATPLCWARIVASECSLPRKSWSVNGSILRPTADSAQNAEPPSPTNNAAAKTSRRPRKLCIDLPFVCVQIVRQRAIRTNPVAGESGTKTVRVPARPDPRLSPQHRSERKGGNQCPRRPFYSRFGDPARSKIAGTLCALREIWPDGQAVCPRRAEDPVRRSTGAQKRDRQLPASPGSVDLLDSDSPSREELFQARCRTTLLRLSRSVLVTRSVER